MTFRIQVFFYQRSEHDIKTGQLHTLHNQSAIQNFKIHRTLEQQQFLHKIGFFFHFFNYEVNQSLTLQYEQQFDQ